MQMSSGDRLLSCGTRMDHEMNYDFMQVQRSDDTEEKCRVRLQVFHENNAAVETVYSDILKPVSDFL